ncbi:MAG: 3'(2'),5'-bisphosphate nucleotidase CysQ [Chitinophagaceae bacterium]|nr:3'(2'),5'-bisphosphate nucleotidase CysQ [Chitinophagaceae bacterium]
MTIDRALIEKILPVAQQAGEAIMEVYHSEGRIHVAVKDDRTPLTIADKAAHTIIAKGLRDLFPGIPVLSEEGAAVSYDERKNWDYYWCVDPLDGTKEFIHRRDDFTVNIALIHRRHSVMGVIYAPAHDTMYFGSEQTGGWRKKEDQDWQPLFADKNAKAWTAIGSRSHASEEEQEVLKAYPVVKTIAAGSSLKFCRVAEGSAHIYYRHGPTMEWDTAAGQAIAEAGGALMTGADGSPFLYNKPSLLNGGFICRAGNVG